MFLNPFYIKRFLDKKTNKTAKVKKVIFPKDASKTLALACVEWVKGGFYTVDLLWATDSKLPGCVNLFFSEMPIPIISARVLLGYLIIKFKNPREAGNGINFYHLQSIDPEIIRKTKKTPQNSGAEKLKMLQL